MYVAVTHMVPYSQDVVPSLGFLCSFPMLFKTISYNHGYSSTYFLFIYLFSYLFIINFFLFLGGGGVSFYFCGEIKIAAWRYYKADSGLPGYYAFSFVHYFCC